MENKVEYAISDGIVRYEHSKPLAEYDNKKPMVQLTFTVAEGSDPGLVAAKVMGIAMEIVERAIATNIKVVGKDNPVKITSPEEFAQPRGWGRPRKEPLPIEADVNLQREADDAASITEPEELTTTETDAILDKLEEQQSLTLKGDIQPMAQRVSAHLRKVDGNINKLRDVIKACGGASLLTIPQENWPLFLEEAKKLLP